MELITLAGSYWGDIIILSEDETTYLYFKSRCLKLDEEPNLDTIKYNFRSMDDTQKDANYEILIDASVITEIMCKHFLGNPTSVELFDTHSNCMYFFNLFTEDLRFKFITKLVGVCKNACVIINARKEFQKRKYQNVWKN